MEIEQRAQEIANSATLRGPQTVPEILAEYERRLEEEKQMMAESKAKFEAGEILEEEVYEGDLLILTGVYPLLMEARVFGKIYANYLPVQVRTLREAPDSLDDFFIPKLRAQVEAVVIENLASK